MLGLELVADRKKTPAGNSYMAAIAAGAHQAGAMIRTSGNIVILSPPMILSSCEATQINDSLGLPSRMQD
jgi:putrescine---pyruvate transaminase